MADALIVIDVSTNQRGKDARICDLANCWFVRSFLRSLSEKRCLVVVTTAEERVESDTLWKDE